MIIDRAGYRLNVGIILVNESLHVFWGRRQGHDTWQFPQGGVQEGESFLAALHREVREEILLEPEDYRILKSRGPYRYLFMEGRKKEGYDGQEQYYFQAELVCEDTIVRLSADCREFRAARWIPPATFDINWVAPMKRTVYQQVFQDFFDIIRRE